MEKSNPRPEHAPLSGSLVRTIHAAAIHASEWPQALDQLRDHLGAQFVTLGHHEFTTGAEAALFESPGGSGFSEGMAAFSARNPWFMSTEGYVSGRVMTGDELISQAELRRTDFFRGFLRPRGLIHRLCGVISRREGGAYMLAAYRGDDQDGFDECDKARLRVALDHITLSLESQWRWEEADGLRSAMLSLAESDNNPVLLVTGTAESVYRNAAADQLLGRNVGLRLDGRRVQAVSPVDQRLLIETIAELAQRDPASSTAAPRVLTLASHPPTPPVAVVIRAAGQVFMREAGCRRGLVMITVRGSHAGHNPATCVFARQYELTAAQAKVSALVFAGQPLSMIAHSLNVSENTVRSHLKQVYQKTETHGQMDLVHLHARVCTAAA